MYLFQKYIVGNRIYYDSLTLFLRPMNRVREVKVRLGRVTLHNKVYVCCVLLADVYCTIHIVLYLFRYSLSLSLTHPVPSLLSYSIVECVSLMAPLADFGRQLSCLVRPA